jgi:dephospho-CoA kinase
MRGDLAFSNIPDSIKSIARPYLLDAPMLVEYGGLHRVNNNVIVVDTPYDTCISRIMKRDSLTQEAARARLNSQMKTSDIKKRIQEAIDMTGTGWIEIFKGDDN